MADYMLRLTQEENIVLGAPTVQRLIEGRSGDAALLYLCLARNKAANADGLRAELGWTAAQFAAAEDKLRAMGLIRRPAAGEAALAPPEKTAPPPPETALPDYSREDVMNSREGDAPFAALLRETERKLGRLSDPSVKKLLGLYDYLGLPADVIYLLISYCAERKAEQFGAEKPPTMREIEKTGYQWARLELFSAEAADAYLRSERERRSKYGAYMEVLHLGARAPVSSEEKYLGAWLDWGFPPETVALAYDKTMLNCHEFKWAYCNGILKRWHEKGIRTAEQAKSENSRKKKSASAASGGDKNAWMDEFLK